jgi:hypothetical protein
MAKKSELEILYPEKRIPTNMGWIEVRPFTLGMIGRLGGVLGDIGSAIKFTDGRTEIDFAVLLYLLGRDEAQALRTVLKAASDINDEQLENLDADSSIELLSKVWEISLNPFFKKLGDRLVKKPPETPPPESSLNSLGQDSVGQKLTA